MFVQLLAEMGAEGVRSLPICRIMHRCRVMAHHQVWGGFAA